MISKEEFLNWIEKEIMPQLKEVEKERQEKLLFWRNKIGIFSIGLFLLLMLFNIGEFTSNLAIGFAPFGIGIWKLYTYQKEIKKRFFKVFLEKFHLKIANSEQIPCDSIPELAKHGLLANNTYKIDDCFYSSDSKYPFYVREALVYHMNDGNKTIDFQGPIIYYCLDKEFGGETLLLANPKVLEKYLSIPFFKLNRNLEELRLEDIDINEQYSLYSTNQLDARIALTPAYIERIKKLNSIYQCSVSALFKGKQLILAIDTRKNMFEFFDISKPVSDIKIFENFYDEVSALFEFQELLKLK